MNLDVVSRLYTPGGEAVLWSMWLLLLYTSLSKSQQHAVKQSYFTEHQVARLADKVAEYRLSMHYSYCQHTDP